MQMNPYNIIITAHAHGQMGRRTDGWTNTHTHTHIHKHTRTHIHLHGLKNGLAYSQLIYYVSTSDLCIKDYKFPLYILLRVNANMFTTSIIK